jgi:hypothetical protein
MIGMLTIFVGGLVVVGLFESSWQRCDRCHRPFAVFPDHLCVRCWRTSHAARRAP